MFGSIVSKITEINLLISAKQLTNNKFYRPILLPKSLAKFDKIM